MMFLFFALINYNRSVISVFPQDLSPLPIFLLYRVEKFHPSTCKIIFMLTEIPVKSAITAVTMLYQARITPRHLEKNLVELHAAFAQILIISNKFSYLWLPIFSF